MIQAADEINLECEESAAIRIQALTRRWLASNVLIEGFAAAIFLQAAGSMKEAL